MKIKVTNDRTERTITCRIDDGPVMVAAFNDEHNDSTTFRARHAFIKIHNGTAESIEVCGTQLTGALTRYRVEAAHWDRRYLHLAPAWVQDLFREALTDATTWTWTVESQ